MRVTVSGCICCVFLQCVVLAAFPAPVFAEESKSPAAPVATVTPAQFRRSDDAVEKKLGISIFASLAILAGGAVAVYLGKRRIGWDPNQEGGARIKVLTIRKISARLSIVMIETSKGNRVTFADNGQSLLLLSEDSNASAKSENSANS